MANSDSPEIKNRIDKSKRIESFIAVFLILCDKSTKKYPEGKFTSSSGQIAENCFYCFLFSLLNAISIPLINYEIEIASGSFSTASSFFVNMIASIPFLNSAVIFLLFTDSGILNFFSKLLLPNSR